MSEEKSGNWWGSTLGKLRTALSKTKEAVVDAVVESPTDQAATTHDPDLSFQTGSQLQATNESTAPVDTNGQMQTAVHVEERLPTPVAKPERKAISITDDYLEDLEEKLIRADLGLPTVDAMVESLRKQAKQKNWTSLDVEAFLKEEFSKMLLNAQSSHLKIEPKLAVILVVGVNGTGKTTSIGKLCYRLKLQGKRVLMAAADTFRAAAETQLEIWAERAQVDIVRLPDGSDPGAVVFKALQKGREGDYDVLVIDTAGRLHNKTNLMAELGKVRSVIDKNAPDLVIESLLVLDASTGQNGLQQAKVFTEVCKLTGVILTKLDGSAKGGVIFGIANELKLPVKLIGLGEKIEDLRDFEPGLFIEALF